MPASTPLIDGKTNWELNLERSREECDKADRELWPNRVALRARYNAQRISFLETQREQERKTIDPLATGTYRRNENGIFMPVPNTYHTYRAPHAPGAWDQPARVPVSASQPEPLRYENPYYRRADAEPAPYRYQRPKTDDSEYTVPGDEQKFIQRIGMNSNCNVNVQSKHYNTEYRMFCEKCKATQPIAKSIVTRWDANQSDIAAFCAAHRHDVEAPLTNMAEGRKFRI